jgi:hypothetical protein
MTDYLNELPRNSQESMSWPVAISLVITYIAAAVINMD